MFDSLVFLDIAQNCSLGQCLTSSRATTSKKKKKVVGAEMIFSILMSLSVHSNLSIVKASNFCGKGLRQRSYTYSSKVKFVKIYSDIIIKTSKLHN